MVEPSFRHQDNMTMNKIITLLVVIALLVSCGTSRKLQQSGKETSIDSLAVQETESVNTEKSLKLTQTEKGKITITEVEFYPPIPNPSSIPGYATGDSTKSEYPRPTANVDLQNVGNIKGTVKSVKQTVIESNVEEKGESKETKSQEQSKSNANVSKQETESQKQETPAPDPYRWRYVFYISLIGLAVLLYLKRVPILNWIKKILSGLRKIL